ncbi:MAG TPA: hypothetical protein VFL61_01525 [Gaiellaceae bacterium]|nr:hypothetical protein [Gaiellaceae bacterium]
MRTGLVFVTALALLGAAAAWAVFGSDGGGPSPTYVSEHPVDVPAAARTVLVSAAMPAPSETPDRLSARLERGTMPTGPTSAEVMTDTDCTPDARMISRCRNELRLADGTTIVLRHPHDMRTIPCLAPGERVSLVPAV